MVNIVAVVLALLVGFIAGMGCMWVGIPTAGTMIVDTKNPDADVYNLQVRDFMVFHNPRKTTVKIFIENHDFDDK